MALISHSSPIREKKFSERAPAAAFSWHDHGMASSRARTVLLSAVLAAMLLRTDPVCAKAVISEVLWPGSDLGTADEWVEIAGAGDAVTPLSGWTLTSVNTSGNEITILTFSTGATLAAGEFLVVSRYSAAQSRLAAEPAFVTSDMSLPNSKLLLRLRDAAGQIMDQADDGSGAPFAGENSTTPLIKASMERLSFLGPGSDAGNWATASASRGLDAGSPVLATPGFARTRADTSTSLSAGGPLPSSSSSSSVPLVPLVPSVPSVTSSSSRSSSSPIQQTVPSSSSFADRWSLIAQTPDDRSAFAISGVQPNPAGKDQGREWVEIQNATARDQSLEGWSVVPVGGKSGAVTFGSVVLQPGQARRFGSAELRLALTNQQGELRLLSPVGAVVSRVRWKDASDDRVYYAQEVPAGGVRATVVHVVDGDTIDVEIGAGAGTSGLRKAERVRLIGVDAPEIHASDPRSAALAKRSLHFMQDLLRGGEVALDFDGDMRDAYGRLIAYVVTPLGGSAQEALLEEGLASVEQRFSFSRLEKFLAVQREAQMEGLGMWAFGVEGTEGTQGIKGTNPSTSLRAGGTKEKMTEGTEVTPLRSARFAGQAEVVEVKEGNEVLEVSKHKILAAVFSISSTSSRTSISSRSRSRKRASTSPKSKSKRSAAARKASAAVKNVATVSSSAAVAPPFDDGLNYSPMGERSREFKEFKKFEGIKELIEEPALAPPPSTQTAAAFPMGMLSILLSGAASLSGIAGWILGKMRG